MATSCIPLEIGKKSIFQFCRFVFQPFPRHLGPEYIVRYIKFELEAAYSEYWETPVNNGNFLYSSRNWKEIDFPILSICISAFSRHLEREYIVRYIRFELEAAYSE